MGVSRLWSLIKANQDSVVSFVDLVDLAKSYTGHMKILIDFYSWEWYMRDKFWKSMNLIAENNYLMFAGGEYKMMDMYIKNLIEQLRSVNIELVFYLDGAKGSAYMSTRQKMRTWKSRYFEELKRLKKYFEFLKGEIALEAVDLEHLTRPCLQEVQNVLTLQELGCTIHLRISGEADYILAKHVRDDGQAYCIFSNDTDFCIFPGSVYLAADFFDIHNDLGLERQTLSVQRPEKLICGVIKNDDIMKLLGLPDHSSLVELAIIGGNDFTSPFLINLPDFKSQYCGQFGKLAELVQRCKVAECCDFFGPAIAQNAVLEEAVQHSRKFYMLTLEDEEEKQTGYIFSLITEGIKLGRLPSTIVSMHRGIYWHRQVLEDPSPGLPTAEGILSKLRSYVYKILLPHHKTSVIEIGRTANKPIEEIEVKKADDARVPSLAQVQKCSFLRNLKLFEYIIQHQETEPVSEGKSYFKLYGTHRGFLCYLLRYFLLMNWDQNLYLSEQEFLVIVAWTIEKHNDSHYQKMKIVPSTRCVSVENWFLSLYRNAYAFLGNVLGVSHEFPAPRELFCGGTWVALYTSCAVFEPNPDYREPPPLSVSMDDMKNASLTVSRIVNDNRHVIKNIIRDLYPFC